MLNGQKNEIIVDTVNFFALKSECFKEAKNQISNNSSSRLTLKKQLTSHARSWFSPLGFTFKTSSTKDKLSKSRKK